MSTGEAAGLSGEGVGLDDDHLGDTREGQEEVEEEVPRINVEIPRCVANLGSDIHFVKLPNFLSVETRYQRERERERERESSSCWKSLGGFNAFVHIIICPIIP